MTFNVNAAKKAGYSDEEINEFLSKNEKQTTKKEKTFDIKSAKAAGYSDKEINDFLKKNVQKPSSSENALARSAMQATIGGAKGALYASPAGAPAALAELTYPAGLQNVISELMESDIEQQQRFPGEIHPLNREQVEKGAQAAQEKYIGKGGLAEGAITAPYRAAGIETEPQSASEKSIKGISELFNLLQSGKINPETLKKTLGGALTGEATKQGLEELGVPEPIASLFSIGAAATVPHIQPSVKTEAKMPSGLTELKAVEAKVPSRGRITKEQQTKAINRLNEEASTLFKSSAEKRIPLKEKLEKGFDFEKSFENRFGQLKSLAEKANPDINTSPLNQFLRESAEKYKGIPRLDKEAASIVREIKAFAKRPATDLKDLYKIFRSNNRKQRFIRERATLSGTQKEYSDFLAGMNKKIFESAEKTLPENSAWIKNFKDLNTEYASYIKSKKALDQMKGVLGETPDPKSVQIFATNAKKQKELAYNIGKEAADEIVQIAKDLHKSTKAIHKIPVRERAAWEVYLPFSIFLPHGGAIATAAGVHKAYEISKRVYGAILTSPAKRKLYTKALKAIEANDMKAYLLATQKLSEELSKQTED